MPWMKTWRSTFLFWSTLKWNFKISNFRQIKKRQSRLRPQPDELEPDERPDDLGDEQQQRVLLHERVNTPERRGLEPRLLRLLHQRRRDRRRGGEWSLPGDLDLAPEVDPLEHDSHRRRHLLRGWRNSGLERLEQWFSTFGRWRTTKRVQTGVGYPHNAIVHVLVTQKKFFWVANQPVEKQWSRAPLPSLISTTFLMLRKKDILSQSYKRKD